MSTIDDELEAANRELEALRQRVNELRRKKEEQQEGERAWKELPTFEPRWTRHFVIPLCDCGKLCARLGCNGQMVIDEVWWIRGGESPDSVEAFTRCSNAACTRRLIFNCHPDCRETNKAVIAALKATSLPECVRAALP